MSKIPPGCISTFSGKVVNPTQLKVDDVVFDDLVHSISGLCRFNAHISDFYSVAQHSVLVAEYASSKAETVKMKKDLKLASLCHDLSEAFIGDIPAPVKPFISICCFGENVNIREYEKAATRVILKSLDLYYLHGLIEDDNGIVHNADRVLCNSESFYLRGYKINENLPIVEDKIVPMSPKDSYQYFMKYWNELNEKTNKT